MKKSKTIIEILSLFVFICCVAYMIFYFVQGNIAQNDISALQQVVADAERNEENDGGDYEEINYAENGMIEKYYLLYQQNNDMVGWLRIDNTEINYPVMYNNSDNEYYLHKNFEKEYSYSGLPFMDIDCDLSLPSDNLIIYGHNMKNGTMFADLLKYRDENFCRENNTIYFDTMYEKHEYVILATFNTRVGSANEFRYYEFTNAQNADEFSEYVSKVKSIAKYDTGETAEYGDKLLTLSTCSYNTDNERFVVVAKCVK